MQLDRNVASRIHLAFPAALANDVDVVLETIVPATHPPMEHDIGEVKVDGEPIRIPWRVYFPQRRADPCPVLTPQQEHLRACIFTRHDNGHVRESAVKQVIMSVHPWASPFVIQLLGEYVVEIVEVIQEHVEDLKQPRYERFIAENPRFMALTRRRAISYWNCYYRDRWIRKDNYPALDVLRIIDPASSSMTRLDRA